MNLIRWVFTAGMFVACAMPAPVIAQGSIPAPTINDRDPGVDGNAGFQLPYEFRRQAVFYRTHGRPVRSS
jgi:hypothetical protein